MASLGVSGFSALLLKWWGEGRPIVILCLLPFTVAVCGLARWVSDTLIQHFRRTVCDCIWAYLWYSLQGKELLFGMQLPCITWIALTIPQRMSGLRFMRESFTMFFLVWAAAGTKSCNLAHTRTVTAKNKLARIPVPLPCSVSGVYETSQTFQVNYFRVHTEEW